MKKRLVSILLVLVMVLGMLPTVAFAADTAAPITTAEEFAARMAGIGQRYPYLVAEVDGRTGIYVQSVEETAPAAPADDAALSDED